MRRVLTALVVGVFGALAPASAQDAVVKIYTVGSSGAGQGTGFFSSKDGQIVTAYHVVQNATRIEVVHDRLGSFSDIEVEFISPDHDLAVLQIVNTIVQTPFMSFRDVAPTSADELETDGYPRGGEKQQFHGRPTRSGFVSAQTIRDSKGVRLFNQDMDVVSLDLTIYSGMSGAPVVGGGGVIGVLSGSYQEGGGIAWAIPTKYLRQLQEVRKKPTDMSEWPRLTLMSNAWQNLRASVRLNASAAAAYDQYVDQVEGLARVYDELHEHVLVAYNDFAVLKPFLEKVASDPRLGSDTQAAREFLEYPASKSGESFRKMVDLLNEYGSTKRQVAVAMSNIMAWVVDESNLSNTEGVALTKKMKVIRDDYKDLQQGLDAYLGIDLQRLGTSLPNLAQGLHNATPAQEARAWIAFIDAWQPALEAYGSYQALTYMTRDISKFRRVAQLFESVVYRSGATR